MYGKNHQRFVETFRHMGGQELETKQIKAFLSKRFPEMKEGSMLPNDHGEGNKHPCRCACTGERIFDRIRRGRIKRGLYRVRPNL